MQVLGILLEAVLRVVLPLLMKASEPTVGDGDPATAARDALRERIRETWGQL